MLQELSAKGDINIKSTQNIALNNNTYSRTKLNLDATEDINFNHGNIVAKNIINIKSKNLNNKTKLIAGINLDNSQNTNGSININTHNKVNNTGTIQSTNNINIATNELNNQITGTILAGNDLVIKKHLDSGNIPTALITNAGNIHSNNNNTITVNTLNNNTGTITASNQLTLTAYELNTTDGQISGKNTNITTNNLTSTGTKILASEDILLNITNIFNNKGEVKANNNLGINANTLNNYNLIVSDNASINTTTVNNKNTGIIHANNKLDITSTNLNNAKQLSSNNILEFNISQTINNQNAQIASLGDSTISAKNLNNTSGKILSNANQNLTIEQILNNQNGLIQSIKTTNINTSHLNNINGKVEAGTDLNLNVGSLDLVNSILYGKSSLNLSINALDNIASSSIGSGGDLSINANDYITNQAQLKANGKLTLSTQGAITNSALISSQQALSLTANKLINHSTISGGVGNSYINITGGGDIINHSKISSQQNLSVNAHNITNNGFFNAGQDLTLTTTNNLTNNKTLFAGNNMYLYVSNTLNNTEDANIFAFNNLTIAKDKDNNKTNKIINNKAVIQTYQGNIDIYAKLLENKTDTPSVTGSYNPNKQTIVGGKVISETTNGNTTTKVEVVLLNNSPTKAQLNSGKNMTLVVDVINNKYSVITAVNNIHLSAEVVDNQAIQIVKVTTTSTKKYNNYKHRHKLWKNKHSHHDYIGTDTNKSVQIIKIVTPTIQAGGNITGNINNLNNGNIKKGVAVSTIPGQTQNTSTSANTNSIDKQAINNINSNSIDATKNKDISTDNIQAQSNVLSNIAIPTGDYGLFIQSKNPNSKYLIETNPEFTLYANFISSDYLLKHINFDPDKKIKLIGDGFYQQKLIREQLFAQTGKRFLQKDITSDNDQYQRLMDNAITTQSDLELVPGISLSKEQIYRLTTDIIWLEEQAITLADGSTTQVLVPVVYIANPDNYKIIGGQIIAGNDIDITTTNLINAGLIQAGANISIQAFNEITNQGGSIKANATISLLAQNNINNISGTIKASDINLTSITGDINIIRFKQDVDYANGNYTDKKKLIGNASNIIASNNISLNANNTVIIQGSNLKADGLLTIQAKKLAVKTTVQKTNFFGGDSKNYLKERSTTHLGSNLTANDININTSGNTSITGSKLNATNNLNIQAKAVDIKSVNNTTYRETKSSFKGFLSKSTTTTKTARSTNIASNLTANNINLTTTKDSINIIGSNITANKQLNLDSAKDINIQVGYDGTLDESHTKKSGFFTGGALFSKSEDLEGKLTQTAVSSNLNANNINLNLANNFNAQGININTKDRLTINAQDINIQNAHNNAITYSKHNKISVSIGDVVKNIANPTKLINNDNGKLSFTLATANIDKTTKHTEKTTVVTSNITSGSDGINLNAKAKDKTDTTTTKGNISLTGVNLNAKDGDINLNADNNVTIKEAIETTTTKSSEMHGRAKLKFVIKNEYTQIKPAIKAVKTAKNNIKKAKKSYQEYKNNLAKQYTQLQKLKSQLNNNKSFVEQTDIDDM